MKYHVQGHKIDTRNQVGDQAGDPVGEADAWSFWNVSALRVFQDDVFGDLERGESEDPTGHRTDGGSAEASEDTRNAIAPENVTEHRHSSRPRRHLHARLHHRRWMEQRWLNGEENGANHVELCFIQPNIIFTHTHKKKKKKTNLVRDQVQVIYTYTFLNAV